MNDSPGSGSGDPGDPYRKPAEESPYGPPPAQNPYGQPPSSPPPYGQPFGQPSSSPYGQPAEGSGEPSPYGQQPFGQAQGAQPAYGQGYGYAAPGRDPNRRPATVTAAAVITLVCAGLTGLLVLLSLAFLGTMRGDVLNEIEESPGFDEVGISADDLVGLVLVMFVVLAVWCLIACVLAIFVLRGSEGARITLVVSAAVSAVFSLIAIGSGVSVITLVAGVAVIVLLFTGGASEWFRTKGPHAQGSGYPPPQQPL